LLGRRQHSVLLGTWEQPAARVSVPQPVA
jgi:hypothetical protein